ncbi:Mor transcription activator family protein [Serratia symbiotica]|uniref:Mor transcription activator family protein n=1 Tax=Serratia symbiotica TaxID=138074 RepID=UPI001CF02EAC
MGNNFYITNRATRNFHDRNAQILSDFYQGVSHRELSKKYGHSVQWIYKIIADERKKEKVTRLFLRVRRHSRQPEGSTAPFNQKCKRSLQRLLFRSTHPHHAFYLELLK